MDESNLFCILEDLDDFDKERDRNDRSWVDDFMSAVVQFQTRLDELSLEEYPLRSIANTLIFRKVKVFAQPLSLESHETQSIIQLALGVIERADEDAVSDSDTAASFRYHAYTILLTITMNMNRDQTRLVYNNMIPRVKVQPDVGRYCNDHGRSPAVLLSGIKFEYVLTKDEALALIDELLPFVGKAFLELNPHAHPYESDGIVHGILNPNLECAPSTCYSSMNLLLFKLQRYVGADKYREHTYSKVRGAEKDKLSADLLVAVGVQAMQQRPDMWKDDGNDSNFQEFVSWMLQLLSKSDGPIRNHLLYLIYHHMFLTNTQYGGLYMFAPKEFAVEVALRLLEDFIARDDPVADCIIMDYVDECNSRRLEIFDKLPEEKKSLVKEKLKRLDSDPNFVQKAVKRHDHLLDRFCPDTLLAKRLIDDLETKPRAAIRF